MPRIRPHWISSDYERQKQLVEEHYAHDAHKPRDLNDIERLAELFNNTIDRYQSIYSSNAKQEHRQKDIAILRAIFNEWKEENVDVGINNFNKLRARLQQHFTSKYYFKGARGQSALEDMITATLDVYREHTLLPKRKIALEDLSKEQIRSCVEVAFMRTLGEFPDDKEKLLNKRTHALETLKSSEQATKSELIKSLKGVLTRQYDPNTQTLLINSEMYDLSTQAWLPYFDEEISAYTQGIRHPNENAMIEEAPKPIIAHQPQRAALALEEDEINESDTLPLVLKEQNTLAPTNEQKLLNITCWTPPPNVTPIGVIAAVHGWCDSGIMWRQYAEQKILQGYVVYACDLPGFGYDPGRYARNEAGLFEDTPIDKDVLIQHLQDFITIVKTKAPNQPITLTGHSLGAAIIGINLENLDGEIQNIELFNPAISSMGTVWQIIQNILTIAMSNLLLALFSFFHIAARREGWNDVLDREQADEHFDADPATKAKTFASLHEIMAHAKQELSKALKDTKKNVTIYAGEMDVAVAVEDVRSLEEGAGENVKFKYFTHADHTLPKGRDAQFVASELTTLDELYQKWKTYPHNPSINKQIEHEIKLFLGLDTDSTEQISLAEIVKAKLQDVESFEDQLSENLAKQYPYYFSQLVVNLKNIYKQAAADSVSAKNKYETFLITIASIKAPPDIYETVLLEDPDIAIAAVKQNPKIFFYLSNNALAAHVYSKFFQEAISGNNDSRKLLGELNRLVQENSGSLDTTGYQQIKKAYEVAEAEAIYEEYLIEKALANFDPKSVRFDPQGHMLTEVSLEDKDYLNILNSLLTNATQEEKDRPKETLERLLGGTQLTPTTFCNLDIAGFPEIEEAFIASVRTAGFGELTRYEKDEYPKIIKAWINSDSRSTATALQEEVEMHMRLVSRVLEKSLIPLPNETIPWAKIRTDAALKINQEVQKIFLRALMNSAVGVDFSQTDPKFDLERLNRELDAARKDWPKKAKGYLVEVCNEKIPNFKYRFDNTHLDNEEFASTTATNLDYLRTNKSNETVTRISATNKTAHDKKPGGIESLAHRNIIRNHYTVNKAGAPQVDAREDYAAESRVPVIGDELKETDDTFDFIKDVEKKLRDMYETKQARLGGYTGPLIYNLFTTLYHAGSFFDQNNQREKAKKVLAGAHQFNRQQITNHAHSSLVYVQSIPINQHGASLSHTDSDDVIREASIMVELALLHTLSQNAYRLPFLLNRDVQKRYQEAHALYSKFLRAVPAENYFYNSKPGLTLLHDFNAWKSSVKISGDYPNASVQKLVTMALLKIYTENQHQTLQFGMLVQSLSVFLERSNIEGCKSANERFQGVAGRNEVLTSMSFKTRENYSSEENTLQTCLVQFNNGQANLEDLQNALDDVYNTHGLQGSVSAISAEDQGAPSKVETFSDRRSGKIGFFETNTNIAESGRLSNLSQAYAGKMQMHKHDPVAQLNKLVAQLPGPNAPKPSGP